MTDSAAAPTVLDVVSALDRRYPREWAESWDRVGLVLGDFDHSVRRVLCVVDCVPETVDQALAERADLIVAHHPLLLKPVRGDVGLYSAHTNADVANPGVSDALAARLRLRDPQPLVPATGAAAGEGRGLGRTGRLDEPMSLAEFTGYVATLLPTTTAGVRAAGDPAKVLRTIAVCGGAGDSFLADATRAGVDAYLCADLRHHPASEHLAEDGPALVDVAHWATERPWLDDVAAWLSDTFGAETIVSDVDTDPWTVHARDVPEKKEPLL